MSEKVIWLAFKNDNLQVDAREFMACKHCRNKTYVFIYEGEQRYPLVQCAACGAHIGNTGWAENDS